jgi:hypothetical protein
MLKMKSWTRAAFPNWTSMKVTPLLVASSPCRFCVVTSQRTATLLLPIRSKGFCAQTLRTWNRIVGNCLKK